MKRQVPVIDQISVFQSSKQRLERASLPANQPRDEAKPSPTLLQCERCSYVTVREREVARGDEEEAHYYREEYGDID
jgi:hypothetical protein